MELIALAIVFCGMMIFCASFDKIDFAEWPDFCAAFVLIGLGLGLSVTIAALLRML